MCCLEYIERAWCYLVARTLNSLLEEESLLKSQGYPGDPQEGEYLFDASDMVILATGEEHDILKVY